MSSAAVLQMTWTTLNDQQIVIQFDASLSESHMATAQVTDHQVEKGPNITDHIRPLPMRLSVVGFVTDTPVSVDILSPTNSTAGRVRGLDLQTGNASAQVLQFDTRFFRVQDVFQSLLDAQANGRLVDINTSLKNYTSFAITSVTAPRDAEHGNAVEFTVELQQIITVSVVTVASTAPNKQKKSAGQKTTKEPTDKQAQQSRSVLHAILH